MDLTQDKVIETVVTVKRMEEFIRETFHFNKQSRVIRSPMRKSMYQALKIPYNKYSHHAFNIVMEKLGLYQVEYNAYDFVKGLEFKDVKLQETYGRYYSFPMTVANRPNSNDLRRKKLKHFTLYRHSGKPVRRHDNEVYTNELNALMEKHEALGSDQHTVMEEVTALDKKLIERFPISLKLDYPTNVVALKAMIEDYGSLAFTIEEDKLVAYILD
jgi:hypothetical protein